MTRVPNCASFPNVGESLLAAAVNTIGRALGDLAARFVFPLILEWKEKLVRRSQSCQTEGTFRASGINKIIQDVQINWSATKKKISKKTSQISVRFVRKRIRKRNNITGRKFLFTVGGDEVKYISYKIAVLKAHCVAFQKFEFLLEIKSLKTSIFIC